MTDRTWVVRETDPSGSVIVAVQDLARPGVRMPPLLAISEHLRHLSQSISDDTCVRLPRNRLHYYMLHRLCAWHICRRCSP